MRNLRLVFFARLLISMFILTVKLLQPVSIQLMFDGEKIEFTQQPAFYSAMDVAIATSAAFISSACLVCLALGVGDIAERVSHMNIKTDFSKVLGRVEDEDEKVILGLIVEVGGSAFQSDLVDRSGFSKGKVSLVLDRLEARGVIQRKRSGMTNLITVTRPQ